MSKTVSSPDSSGFSRAEAVVHRGAFIWFAMVTVIGAVADLGSKAWAVETLTTLPNRAFMWIDPWFEIALSYNRGTAFSAIFDLGEGVRIFLGIAALGVVGGLGWTVWTRPTSRLEAGAFGLLASGAVGNGYDRVWRMAPGGGTGVVDFMKLNYPWGGSWPTFNVADAWLVVGVVLLGWSWFRAMRAEQAAATEA